MLLDAWQAGLDKRTASRRTATTVLLVNAAACTRINAYTAASGRGPACQQFLRAHFWLPECLTV